MRGRIACTVLVLMLTLALTGCMFGPEQKTSTPIDPPPEGVEKKYEEEAAKRSTKSKEDAKDQAQVQLYFLANDYVVPYAVDMPKVEGIAKEAVKMLVRGSKVESQLPEGFSGVLPKGTKVKGLNIQEGTATVDFSKEFLSYRRDMEKKILDAITWTLTGFDSVERVNIWVDGRPLAKMPKGKTTAQGLTRSRGINLELAEGVNISQSMPVTLYFLGQAPDNTVYYVPVTRMINRTDDVAGSVMKELILGPKHGSGLNGALAETLRVNKLQLKDQTVLVDLGGQLLQYGKGKSASKDAVQTIVLSLTENTAADKVKITVNGKAEAKVEGKPLDQAVTRPEVVNPASL
ncbi:MAG: GerMN domain-containing protein [Planifilum sp.]|jgi:germination protein M